MASKNVGQDSNYTVFGKLYGGWGTSTSAMVLFTVAAKLHIFYTTTMNPLILNEPAHQTATGTDGKTTRDQDQLLINFLAAKAECRDIGGHSEEASPAEERARAKYVHAEQQLVESGIPETVLKAVTQLRD